MAPRRRSLRERDEHAIAGPPVVLARQTATDLLRPAESKPSQVTSLNAEMAPTSPADLIDMPGSPQASRSQHKKAWRLGIYFYPTSFSAAKAAYLADWQNGGPADRFAVWIALVLTNHAKLTPAQRATNTAVSHNDGSGSTRSFVLPAYVHHAVRTAVIADQNAGRWVSASAWASSAVHMAVCAARDLNGGNLPTPPSRLPNRLVR